MSPLNNQLITDTAFTIDTSSIKYGPGVTEEVGYEMARLGARKVLIVTDPNIVTTDAVRIAHESLTSENIEVTIYDQVRVEPTDESFKDAILFATEGEFLSLIHI